MKIILASLAGGAAAFLFGWVSWSMLHLVPIEKNPAAAAVTAAMAPVESGAYMTPHAATQEEWESEAMKKRYADGPLTFVVHHKGGGPAMGVAMAKGFGICFLGALILALLLSAARIGNFFGRFLFVAGCGAFVAVAGDGIYWNWFHFPDDYSMWKAIDTVATWAIAGIPLAAILKPSN